MIKKRNLLILYCLLFPLEVHLIAQQKWSNINFTTTLKDTLFLSDHFVLSEFTFSDDDGRLHSAMADESGNEIIDSSEYLIGADCVVNEDINHEIKFSKCSFDNDTLSITIFNDSPAYNDNIDIKAVKGRFAATYQAAYSIYFPGEHYVWETKKQKLKVMSTHFQTGKWLNGFINLEVVEFFKSDTYPLSLSPIKIKGYFKCIIE